MYVFDSKFARLVRLAQKSNPPPLLSIVGPFGQVQQALASLAECGTPRLDCRELLFSLYLSNPTVPPLLAYDDGICRRRNDNGLDLLTE